MGHRAVPVVALTLGMFTAACGEPLIVLGDAPGLMRVVLGVGDSIGTRVDTIATRTRLNEPGGVAFDEASSTLYAADRGANRVSGGVTTRVARIITVDSRGRSRILVDAGGCNPGCILQAAAIAPAAGGLLVADPIGNRLLRVGPGGAVTVVAGTGARGSAPDGAAALSAPLDVPAGVAVGPDGLIYFSEMTGNRVRRISAAGLLETVAGSGSGVHGGDGGPALNAGVVQPAGLLWIGDALYIAEAGAGSVRRVQAGTISTVAGVDGQGFSGDDGPATSARLNFPIALAANGTGRTLYIADRDNDRVRALDLATGIIHTFAGTGSRTWSGVRRPAGETALYAPVALHAGGGFLFISDRGHSVVWRTATEYN